MKSVVVGMSGGVDSTAAVLLLQKAGYQVHGLTLWICGDGKNAEEAATLAHSLSIPHTVLDKREAFYEKVQKPFAESYRCGQTPNPCVACNAEIKFAFLKEYADAHSIPYIATGHYATVCEDNGRYLFGYGKDIKKDQTYFLSQVPPSVLPRLLLPLGDYTKDEVRAIAAGACLSVAKKADSQEICFIPNNDYIAYLESSFAFPRREGKILDENGYMVGIHEGIHRYTVGQRKGLGAFGRKVFVTGINAEENTVSIGENDALFSKGLLANHLNIFTDLTGEVKVKVRSASPRVSANCTIEGDTAHITFETSQRAVTPGQTVAVYKDNFLVGGGTIVNPVF